MNKFNCCIILPLHLYKFDPQGSLDFKNKKEMYEFSINQWSRIYHDYKIIVVCHGIKCKLNIRKSNVLIYWSKYYQEPNKYGLFEENPAQKSIVSEGIKLAINRGFDYVIKGRADSIIYNKKIIEKFLKQNNNKYLITQQTSFMKPFLLGDCFMVGSIRMLERLWSNDNGVLHPDGLKHFAKQLMIIEKNKNFIQLIIDKTIFYDLTDMQIVDLRFNWLHHKNEIKNNVLKDKFIWGVKNRWVKVNKGKITYLDRPNLLTKETYEKLKSKKMIFIKAFTYYIILKKLTYKLFSFTDLYKA